MSFKSDKNLTLAILLSILSMSPTANANILFNYIGNSYEYINDVSLGNNLTISLISADIPLNYTGWIGSGLGGENGISILSYTFTSGSLTIASNSNSSSFLQGGLYFSNGRLSAWDIVAIDSFNLVSGAYRSDIRTHWFDDPKISNLNPPTSSSQNSAIRYYFTGTLENFSNYVNTIANNTVVYTPAIGTWTITNSLTTVPLPPSIWLFGLGSLAFRFISKHNEKQPGGLGCV